MTSTVLLLIDRKIYRLTYGRIHRQTMQLVIFWEKQTGSKKDRQPEKQTEI